MKKKVALIVIFNHKYVDNIERLNYIYKGRFTEIYYLMPFYTGDQPNVIPVFDNSYYFQGFFAQALTRFYHEKYSHYCFIADDLFLNPCVNENNYCDYFNLDEHSSFIPDIHELHHLKNRKTFRFMHVRGNNKKLFWFKMREEAFSFSYHEEGLNMESEIPSYEEAISLFAKHHLFVKPLRIEDVYGYVPDKSKSGTRYCVEYPLVLAYSDIVIVSSQCVKKFCHYCGVFAAANLFVELAIPTALVMSTEKIVTENETLIRGKNYLIQDPKQKYNKKMSRYKNNITTLLKEFPQDKLYIHPLKLSNWTID